MLTIKYINYNLNKFIIRLIFKRFRKIVTLLITKIKQNKNLRNEKLIFK